MKNELIIKKCLKCGALVEVINDCTCDECGITCCGEPMVKLISNSVDASFEKHIPTFEYVDDEILVKYEKAKSVTPGQLCALYLEDGCCIGSGIIKEVRKNDEKLWYLL